jgi:hypothetical protein
MDPDHIILLPSPTTRLYDVLVASVNEVGRIPGLSASSGRRSPAESVT